MAQVAPLLRNSMPMALLAAAAAVLAVAALGEMPAIAIDAPEPIRISATTLIPEGPGPVTLTVVNDTDAAMTGIAVPDSLGADTILGFRADRGVYEPETGTWLIGDLESGASVHLVLER